MQEKTASISSAQPIQFRCSRCNRLLFKGCIKYVEIKCPKCGCIHSISEQDVFACSTENTPVCEGNT